MELYDPALNKRRKKRMTTRRRQPAALRRYWASKRRGKARYDPKPRRRRTTVRRRTTRRYDPYIPYDPRRRTRRRSRRYDPPYGTKGFFGAVLRPLSVILGGFLHNILVSRGMGAKIFSIGNVHMTQAGIGLGAAGVVAEGMNRGKWGEFLNHLGSGALSEGMTAPDIEGIAKSGVAVASKGGGGLMGDSYIPLGAYATAL